MLLKKNYTFVRIDHSFSRQFGKKDREKQIAKQQNHAVKEAATFFELGVNYENGLGGVSVNFEKANHYYQLAAEQGNVKAVVNLGLMYLQGRKGVEKDLKIAFKLFYEAAAKGQDPIAQVNVGLMYANGLGVEKSYKDALKYFLLASESNLKDAQYNAGLIYEKGLGTKKNIEEAIKYYTRAIETGNDLDARFQLGGIHFSREEYEQAAQHFEFVQDTRNEALGKLGYMLYFGKGLSSSKTFGLEKLSLAADRGDTFSQFQLASIFHTNLEREAKSRKKKLSFTNDISGRDEHRMLSLLHACAEKRDTGSLSLLGQIYLKGFRGTAKNEKLAFQYLKQASNQGDANATLKLAQLSLKQKDYNRALSYFRAAAKHGSVRALRQLGRIYLNGLTDSPVTSAPISISGDGELMKEPEVPCITSEETREPQAIVFVVKPDFTAAVNIFKQGTMKRDLGCAFELANLYETRLLVEPESESFVYLKIAADLGNVYAQRAVGDMFSQGLGTKGNLKRACQYYQMAAHRGDVTAQSTLGFILSATEDEEVKNEPLAISYLKLAAQQGDESAIEQLMRIAQEKLAREEETDSLAGKDSRE